MSNVLVIKMLILRIIILKNIKDEISNCMLIILRLFLQIINAVT